jgi:hypothetical protein
VKLANGWRLREHWLTAGMIAVCAAAIFVLSKL